MSKEEAERRIREIGEEYKLEILESIVARDPDVRATAQPLARSLRPSPDLASSADRPPPSPQGAW